MMQLVCTASELADLVKAGLDLSGSKVVVLSDDATNEDRVAAARALNPQGLTLRGGTNPPDAHAPFRQGSYAPPFIGQPYNRPPWDNGIWCGPATDSVCCN